MHGAVFQTFFQILSLTEHKKKGYSSVLNILLCQASEQTLIMYSSHARFCGFLMFSSDNVFKSLSVFHEFLFLYLFSGVFLNRRARIFSLLMFGKQKSLP